MGQPRCGRRLGPLLRQLKWVNLGGGYLLEEGRDLGPLCEAVQLLQRRQRGAVQKTQYQTQTAEGLRESSHTTPECRRKGDADMAHIAADSFPQRHAADEFGIAVEDKHDADANPYE